MNFKNIYPEILVTKSVRYSEISLYTSYVCVYKKDISSEESSSFDKDLRKVILSEVISDGPLVVNTVSNFNSIRF